MMQEFLDPHPGKVYQSNAPLPDPSPSLLPDPNRRDATPPQVRDMHGIKSTKLPQLDLIPKAALVALGNRMELGIQRKGKDGVWNPRKETSAEFTVERLSHVIHHAYDAIDKILRGAPLEGEDDAGAILFGGAVLAVYKDNCRRSG